MKKNAMTRVAAGLALLALTTGCFGPMNATGRLKTWNQEIENRWAGEGVYILLRIPYGGVYTIFALGDLLIFNSIEFWGGENPIEPVSLERRMAVKALDERRHGPQDDEEDHVEEEAQEGGEGDG